MSLLLNVHQLDLRLLIHKHPFLGYCSPITIADLSNRTCVSVTLIWLLVKVGGWSQTTKTQRGPLCHMTDIQSCYWFLSSPLNILICWNMSGHSPKCDEITTENAASQHLCAGERCPRVKRSAALQEIACVGNGSSTRCRNHQLCLSSSGLVSIAAVCLTFE